jgi:type III restriction enzyme
MKYSLKDYQREAVDDLKKYFNFYYFQKGKMISFKAPTGSGKTFMISAFIEEIINENEEKDFSFVWASIGKGELQIQSYEAVSKYLTGYPKCSLLDSEFFGSRSYIKKYEVVFVNWEKLVSKDSTTGDWKNSIMKDQEGASFIDVIEETKRRGTNIILIIDESHIGKSQESRILELKDTIIVPDLTIEMSATPLTKPDIEVKSSKVIDEGMIKESIIVNEGIDDSLVVNDDINSEELILEYGFNKRLEIIEEYKKLESNVNPLLLIQIPNKDQGDAKLSVITDFLRNKGVTLENGKLKIWLTGKEHNFDKHKIKDNEDLTEFLVFKTAVATGWDCPRAHILVKFREGKSETFEIQTVGRILRTAEAKSYGNYKLDNAYIFTNLAHFETQKDSYNPNAIKTEMSFFRLDKSKRPVYTPIHLKSFYRSRANDYNSADSGFYQVFDEEFCKYFNILKDSIDYSNPDKMRDKGFDDSLIVKNFILREDKIETRKIDEEQLSKSGVKEVTQSESDQLFSYYNLIKESLNGLAYARSKSPINGAIVGAFSKYYHTLPRNQKISMIQKLVLNNRVIFSEILSKSTARYKKILEETAGKNGMIKDFEIEGSKAYSRETYKEVKSDLALYQPFRMKLVNSDNQLVNKLEKAFIHYLDSKPEHIDWHWHNGDERIEINFGISYNNGTSTFYPDFIVKFKDGRIGIFDTKPIDYNLEDNKIKANALFRYLEEQNKMRDSIHGKLVGGIVVSNSSSYMNFYFYNEPEYVDFKESQKKWKTFDSLL